MVTVAFLCSVDLADLTQPVSSTSHLLSAVICQHIHSFSVH